VSVYVCVGVCGLCVGGMYQGGADLLDKVPGFHVLGEGGEWEGRERGRTVEVGGRAREFQRCR